MAKFRSMRLQNWRQFASISIDFHPRLTVITGSNGAGKSTVLNICAQHFGYSRPFLATPKKTTNGTVVYDSGIDYWSTQSDYYTEIVEDDQSVSETDDPDDEFIHLPRYTLDDIGANPRFAPIPNGAFVEIGKIDYDDGNQATIGFPEHGAQSYPIQINQQQSVPGVNIGSHRTLAAYQPVQGLSLQLINIQNAYQSYLGEHMTRWNGGQTQYSPLYRMKETLIAMAAFGEGNVHLERNPELSQAFEGFGKVLKKILPREFGFQKLVVRIPDIVLRAKSGEFVIDASSGGISAVIEMAWQLYLFSLSNSEFVVTLDEPENHLHPSMQRTILANLVDTFPRAQFIVATHSPFIVSAVEESRVYVLKYMGTLDQLGFPKNQVRKVQSVMLDQTSKAGSASEILREVLGVDVSIPHWAERRLQNVVAEFEHAEISTDTLKLLRDRLEETGFAEFYPDALAKLVADK